MPLMRGKSDKAFSQNVRTEMDHGKSQKQSLAIAYAMKKKAKKMAEGGEAGNRSPYQGNDDDDMVSRIMKKRCYSEGGKVANEDEILADFAPAEYDVLPLEDDLEFHDTGANSGDYDGAPEKDMDDDDDLVSRVMKKRKDHNPRPA